MSIARFVPAGLCVMLLAATGQALAATPGDSASKADAAKAIRIQLAELDATAPIMNPERKGDLEHEAVFRAQDALYVVTKVKLIGDLWRADPAAAELPALMPYRWENARRMGRIDIAPEVESMATLHPNAAEAIANGHYQLTKNAVADAARDPKKALEAVDGFLAKYPTDSHGAELLYNVVARMEGAEREPINNRIVAGWPESSQARRILGERRRNEAVGKPFELTFVDHLSGKTINMADLQGKVVVIDFWATWCGPCVAELPHLMELYKTYHESGMEILGISLDHPPAKEGDKKLTAFCKEREMTWPQYYQGNYWDSEYSQSWGINSIPAMFIVDKKGVLRSVTARGQLDELIPQLLNEP